MRISDWSSDVCSSDLQQFPRLFPGPLPGAATLAGRSGGGESHCRGTGPLSASALSGAREKRKTERTRRTMSKVIDYYLTLMSPWAYLGNQRFAEITRRTRAQVRVKPVHFGEILPRTGGLPLATRARSPQAQLMGDLNSW